MLIPVFDIFFFFRHPSLECAG